MFSISSSARRLWSQRCGGVAIQIGISLLVLLGMVALSVEVGFLLYKQRQMQSAADAAALTGAMALGQVAPRDFREEARAVAAQLGFVNGQKGVTVTVNNPPTKGNHTGDASAVEAIVSQPQTMSIVGLFIDKTIGVNGRSVGLQTSSTIDGGAGKCMLALNPTASQSIFISNNAVVSSPNCGVVANSTSNTAIVLNNNAKINGPIQTSGNWSLANNASLCNPATNTYCTKTSGASPVADPYADVPAPTGLPACTNQPSSGSQTTLSLSPGHFCNGWNFKNNVTVNLSAGTYYIDSKFSFSNNAKLNATSGATIIINGNYAIDVGNNATLNITAPTEGTYKGIAFAGFDTTSKLQKFSNNAILNITGAIYFPHQTLEVDNNGSTSSKGCTQLIADKLIFMNNAVMQNYCSGTGTTPIGGSVSASLVE